MKSKKRETAKTAGASLGKDREIMEKTLLSKLPPSLKKELIALRDREAMVLEKLNSDKELAQLFLNEPGTALAKMGLTLSSGLQKRLKSGETPGLHLQPREIHFPNGQVITPKIEIGFIGKEE